MTSHTCEVVFGGIVVDAADAVGQVGVLCVLVPLLVHVHLDVFEPKVCLEDGGCQAYVLLIEMDNVLGLDELLDAALVVESLKVLEVATAHNLHPCPPQHAAHLLFVGWYPVSIGPNCKLESFIGLDVYPEHLALLNIDAGPLSLFQW